MVYHEVIFIFWHGVYMRSVDEIPVARTPEGGWMEFPPLVLTDCSDALSDDAVDMGVCGKLLKLSWMMKLLRVIS